MKKNLSIILILWIVALAAGTAQAFTFNDVNIWAGSGSNSAGLVIHWSAPEVYNNTSMPAPIADISVAWGYKFDGTANAETMMLALAAADPRLYLLAGGQPGLGMAILGIGYDLNNNGVFGLSDGSTTYTAADFANGILADQPYGDADTLLPTDPGDLYWGGWYGPNWELWHEQGGNGGFTSAPDRGSDLYWTGSFFSGSHGEWDFSGLGITSLSLEDGSWVGWSVAAGGLDMGDPMGEGTLAWMNHKQAPGEPLAAPVPITGAVWLLGSGLLRLIGICRRCAS
ncbi:hypothetical protein [Desulfobacca acetoxidans]